MGKGFEELQGRWKKALEDPELDKIRAALKDLQGKTTAELLRGKLSAFDLDFDEMGNLSQEQRKELKESFVNDAIANCAEAAELNAFVDRWANRTGLDAAIEESKKTKSRDPIFRIVQTARNNKPALATLGAAVAAGLAKWLNGKKEEDTTPNSETTPDEQEDETSDRKKKKKKKKKKGGKKDGKKTGDDNQSDANDEGVSEGTTSSESAKGSGEDVGTVDELNVDTDVTRKGPVSYKPNPEYSKEKLSGKDFLAKYKSIKDRHERHMFALQQVALKNVPSHFNQFEHMHVVGKSGTQVQFEMARHNQRIGTDSDYVEVPFDGPTAAAAATVQGCSLAPPWIVKKAYEKAKADGGVITFYGGQDLAKKADKTDWESWMMSAEGMAQAFELRREEFDGKEGQITAGHFKAIVPPKASNIKAQTLNINGGNYKDGEQVQPFPGNFHGDSYSDASHGIRLVRNGSLMVNGKPMSWEDFHSNPDYAKEFGFHLIPKGATYASTPELDAFVEANKPKKN